MISYNIIGLFQQAKKYKCTWMHPRSNHWHMLDYVITRQRHVHLTRVMWGATCWSDHCLVRCNVALKLATQKRRRHPPRRKKLDVKKLRLPDIKHQLQSALSASLEVSGSLQTHTGTQDSHSLDERQERHATEDSVQPSKAMRSVKAERDERNLVE